MRMAGEGVVVWYNPRCSKCRGAEELLAALDRAVVARPPELLLPLLEAGPR